MFMIIVLIETMKLIKPDSQYVSLPSYMGNHSDAMQIDPI